jgi:hypothetical protein
MNDDQLFETGTTWKMSAACAIKHLDCTFHGITRVGGCGGACCKKMSFWPPKAGDDPAQCDRLGPEGCTLGDDRPLTCHLYPFRLNKNNTLVLHHTGFYLKHSTCDPCRGKGPRVIDAIFQSLVSIFGVFEAARIRDEVDAGRDPIIDVPQGIVDAMAEEDQWEADNTVPLPRDYATMR